MPPTEPPIACDLPAPTRGPSDRRGGLAAGALLAGGALACILPLILGAGVVAGLWAALTGATAVAAIIVAGLAGGVAWWSLRRRRQPTHAGEGSDAVSCGCGGACG